MNLARVLRKAGDQNNDLRLGEAGTYRTPKKDGGRKKPGIVWVPLDYTPPRMEASKKAQLEKERKLLRPRDKWDS